ncbi:unnamed protein product [Mucor hiemalis]
MKSLNQATLRLFDLLCVATVCIVLYREERLQLNGNDKKGVLHMAIAEVKPPEASSEKPSSDLVKLWQQKKVMLNNLITYKISSPVVCGILMEGKLCSLYKMDVIASGFYRMVLLTSFPLCTISSELCLIPNIFMWMKNLKDITIVTLKAPNNSVFLQLQAVIKLDYSTKYFVRV